MNVKAKAFLTMTVFLSAYLFFHTVWAQPQPSPWYSNRVVVGFWNSTSTNAMYISSKYKLPIVMEDDVLQFAVFRPPAPDTFLNAAKREQLVKYAEIDTLACALLLCGGGGGGGGGTPPPDFSIVANPTSVTFLAGSSGTSAITVTSLNGYSGTVSLSTTVFPTVTNGPAASLSLTSITLSSTTTSGSSTLTVSTTASTPAGSYTISVTGSDGTLFRSVSVSVSVTADFGIAASPTAVNMPGSSSRTSTITLTSTGFSGTVALTVAVSPVVTNGPTASLSPTSVTLSYGGQAQSFLIISTTSPPSGTYSLTVTGISGSISHSAPVSVTVPFPNDQLYGNQWGPPDLNLAQGWQQRSVGTRQRIIAVVDTGVDFGHPDLQGNIWTAADGSHGWNCIANNNNAADDYGHGTAVAGVAAATINNGVGIAGAAQELIMAVKVLDNTGSGTDATVACGIRWAVDHGASVINLSLGGGGTTTLQNSVQYAWSRGALLVAAAGNAGARGVDCPACYNEVIAVSALQQGRTLAAFSNFGPKVELSAPGANIFTTIWPLTASLDFPPGCRGGAFYCFLDGTSFAAPFVSGIAALAWDYNIQQNTRTLSNQNIRDALDAYVVDLGAAGRDESFGFGEPDALTLLANVVGAHSYTLKARWEFFSSSGTEGDAQVNVYDWTTSSWIVNSQTVGNGLTVNVVAGHFVQLYFARYYKDSSGHNVYVIRVDSTGGAPSYSGISQTACPHDFVFPAVPASSTATYWVSFTGDPFAGLVC